jgi:MFS family permease
MTAPEDGTTTPVPKTTSPHGVGVYLLAVGLVIMLAGLLFGYDQGVISGALDGIQKQFSVGTLLLEVITSWVTLGAMAGALIESLAPGAYVLVVGRLLVGFGVGVASVAAPLYAAELAPARLRGRMVSLYQLAITMGIFVAYFADYLLINGDRWRAMLGISAVPGVLLVLAILPLPDSQPRSGEARRTGPGGLPRRDLRPFSAYLVTAGDYQVPRLPSASAWAASARKQTYPDGQRLNRSLAIWVTWISSVPA